MNFSPKNFKTFTSGSEPTFKIRTADKMPLILIQNDGNAQYARGRAEKDEIIAKFQEGADLLLFAWVGEHHTDIFLLSQPDIKDHYK